MPTSVAPPPLAPPSPPEGEVPMPPAGPPAADGVAEAALSDGGRLHGSLEIAGDVAAAAAAWSVPVLGLGVGPLALVLVVLGLPGAWIMIAAAALVELLDGLWLGAGHATFGWWPIAIAVAIAGIGELLEFGAGAVGAARAGSSKIGAVGALLGGLVGAVAGLAIPPPVIGSLAGAFIGTFAGAFFAEWRLAKREARDSMRPAVGATIGRVLGTLAKIPAAAAAWAVLMAACLVRLLGLVG